MVDAAKNITVFQDWIWLQQITSKFNFVKTS